jgi:hypothetical protein
MREAEDWCRRQEFAPPALPLLSRNVALAPLTTAHIVALRTVFASEMMAGRWPVSRLDPEGDDFEQQLWSVAGWQFAVCHRVTGDVIGLVQGVGADHHSQTIGVGFAIDPRYWRTGWPLEAIVLFIDVLFRTLNMRKVYFQVAESTVRHLGNGFTRFVHQEGRYVRHRRRGARYEDWYVFALFRNEWDPRIVRLIGALPRGGDLPTETSPDSRVRATQPRGAHEDVAGRS